MKRESRYLVEGAEWVVESRRDGADCLVVEVGEGQATYQIASAGDGDYVLTDENGVEHRVSVSTHGDMRWVSVDGETHCVERQGRKRAGGAGSAKPGGLKSPMPGKVIEVRVAVGDSVNVGDTLLVVEAMKMEHAIVANEAGTVSAIHFGEGERVQAGAPLVSLDVSGKEE